MWELRHDPRRLRAALKAVAVVLAAYYAAFNAWWIVGGELPPSILRHHFGLPCPTTGCSRSLGLLLDGHWLQSLCYNPCTVPYLLLLGASLAVLAQRAATGGERLLPRSLATAWLVLLAVGWAAKFVLGPAYW